MHFVLLALGAALQTNMILLPSDQSAPPIAEQPKDGSSPARLLNMFEVFTPDSYPAEALRNEEQGISRASISLDAAGRLTDCRIALSSGSASLDRQTCAALKARGKFAAARDAKARRFASNVMVSVKWALPEAPMTPFTDSGLRTIFRFDAKGKAGPCRIELLFNSIAPIIPCVVKDGREERMIKYELAGQPPISRDMVFEEGLRIGGPDGALPIGKQSGETLLRKLTVALTIDPVGAVSNCAPISIEAQEDQRASPWCEMLAEMKFDPLPANQADRSARYLVYFMAVYLRSAVVK